MRTADGAAKNELLSSTEVLGRMAMQRMLAALSTRSYRAGPEPVGERGGHGDSDQQARGVRRRDRDRAGQAARRRPVHPGPGGIDDRRRSLRWHLCVVPLGIGIDGTQHPLLGLVEGSTENTTVATDLLTGLLDRGLDTTRPILVGIDGAKALTAAVVRVFDHPAIQRCQLHKLRNVADKLP